MPGRKPAVTSSEILEHLIKFNIYDDIQSAILKNRNDDVWFKVCDCVKNLIKPVALYVSVYQDRHNIHTLYRKSKGLSDFLRPEKEKSEEIEELKVDSNESDEDSDTNYNYKTIKKPKLGKTKSKKLEFNIILTLEQWNLMCPINANVEDGSEKKVLQEDWTNVMRDAIWETKKLPCSYSFKRHVVKEMYPYIEIEGLCTSFHAEIYVTCDKEPNSEEYVRFNVLPTDSTNIAHTKKTRLQKKQKLKVEQEVLGKLPKQWRRDNAKLKMEHGDPEPATLYSLKQLQRARQDAKCKQLGLLPHQDLFNSLLQMKNNPEFHKFIRDMGFERFFILYWSPEQIAIHNKILEFLNNPLSLDSTGSVTFKIKRDGDSSHVFLSVLLTYIGEMIVPLTQCMSERKDTPFISFWLQSWLQSGADIPTELVTDMGQALKNGACLAFNSLKFSDYNDLCLQILLDKEIHGKLNTQLRTDIAHLIHAMSRWPCFSTCNKSPRILFRKCVGYMTTIDNFKVFQYFLKQVLVVAYSKHHNGECARSLRFLVQTLESFILADDISDIEAAQNNLLVLNDLEEEYLDEKDRLTTKYLQNLKDEILKNIEDLDKSFVGIQSNDYHLSDFGDRLLDLCKDFPCWTNVMNKYFKNPRLVATSARSETYFGELKKTLQKTVLREDKVLVIHCRNIESDMILARAALDNLKKELKLPSKEKKKIDKSYLLATEQWRNKNCEIEQIDISNDSLIDMYPPCREECKKSVSIEESETVTTYLFKEDDKEKNLQVEVNNKNMETARENEKYYDNIFLNIEESNTTIDSSLTDHDYTTSMGKLETNFIHSTEDVKENVEKNDCIHSSKNKSTKNRGIYVSPDPELLLRLQKPNETYKGQGIIKNANKMQPRKMMKQVITFLNTCSFDTLTEILSSACCNIRIFHDILKKNKDTVKLKKDNYKCYATTVFNYAIDGINNTLYTRRAHLLYSIFSIEAGVVNCNTNVSALLSTWWSNYDTTTQTLSCTLCHMQEEKRKPFIFIPNLKIAWIEKFKTLEDELNSYFKSDTLFCPNCHVRSLSSSHTLGPFLYIDCDEVYRPSSYAKKHNIDGEVFTSNLKEIPAEINVDNNKFILCGVVKYLPPIDSNGMGHYIALCRSVHGIWEEKNNLHTYKKRLNKNCDSVLPDIKMSGIF